MLPGRRLRGCRGVMSARGSAAATAAAAHTAAAAEIAAAAHTATVAPAAATAATAAATTAAATRATAPAVPAAAITAIGVTAGAAISAALAAAIVARARRRRLDLGSYAFAASLRRAAVRPVPASPPAARLRGRRGRLHLGLVVVLESLGARRRPHETSAPALLRMAAVLLRRLEHRRRRMRRGCVSSVPARTAAALRSHAANVRVARHPAGVALRRLLVDLAASAAATAPESTRSAVVARLIDRETGLARRRAAV